MDYDATALYPSCMQVNNSSVDSFYGKFRFINKRLLSSNDSRKIALSLINKNLISIGSNLFNLPSGIDIIQDYYKVNYVRKTKNDAKYIETDEINLIDCMINRRYTDEISSFFYQAYSTAYDDKDKEAGRPSDNKLFFTSSSPDIKFSYYSTLVEIHSDTPISEILGIKEKGFLCAKNTKRVLYNRNSDYIDYLKPKKETFTSILKGEGKLDKEVLIDLDKERYQIHTIKLLDGYNLDCTHTLLFANLKKDRSIKYKVYDIKEDTRLFKVVFFYEKIVAKVPFTIKQSVVAYKK